MPKTKDCDNSDLLLWYDNTRRAEKKHAFSAKTGKFRSFGSYTCKSGQCPRKFTDTHSFDAKTWRNGETKRGSYDAKNSTEALMSGLISFLMNNFLYLFLKVSYTQSFPPPLPPEEEAECFRRMRSGDKIGRAHV